MPAIERMDELVEYYAAGCKPRAQWCIGTEHEKIGFYVDSLKPVPYEGERGIRALLVRLATEGWELHYEGENPIALRRGRASITLEPGGQLELSGAPAFTVHETCSELADHLRLLRIATRELGIGFVGVGFQPKWRREDIPWMPKGRYRIMREYMPKVGGHGLDMMLRTATVQSNLDFSSERDMAKKMRVACCLQPLATALYAASPFCEGKPSGFLSHRSRCWLDTDPDRTGTPAAVFREDFGFSHYAQWVLDAPMYFIIRDGRYVDCAGASFRDFLRGKLPVLPGELPTLADWELHNTTVFPTVRLRKYLEMRGADAGPWPWICSLSALWKGLLYSEQALDEAWNWVADWTYAEACSLHEQVPQTALSTCFRDTTVLELCRHMVGLARKGLERLDDRNEAGENETRYLRPLEQTLEQGRTQAEAWLAAFLGPWQGNIDHIFREAAYR